MSSGVVAQSTAAKAKKKTGWMRYFQTLMLIGIVAGIYLSFNGNVLSSSPGLPAQIGDFSLSTSHVETGDKAIAEIRGLFGEDVSYSKAYTAHYKGNSGGVTVRAGEKRETTDAEEAINTIVAGVQKGDKQDYADLSKTSVDGRTVYSLKVKGMPYSLYQSGNKVMWVEVMEGNPSQVLADVVRAFK
ncbi:MAG: hypothetical protein M1358_13025 [Chloroflexi bacterium]|nr:hypothetical protein [Chloroflexota bacterium]